MTQDLRSLLPKDVQWKPLADRLIDGVEPGSTYSMTEMAQMAQTTTDDPLLLGALTFISTCRHAILDAQLFVQTKTGKHILFQEQINKVLNDESIMVEGKSYDATSTYIQYVAPADF